LDVEPAVSYYDGDNDRIKFVRFDGSDWIPETVSEAGPRSPRMSTAMTRDQDGNPQIAFHDSLAESLRFAVWDGAAWQVETIDASGGDVAQALDSDGRPAIAYVFTTDGEPVIAYRDDDADTLNVAWLRAGTWEHETVDQTGWYPAVALPAAETDCPEPGPPLLLYRILGPGDTDIGNQLRAVEASTCPGPGGVAISYQ
jgi:hypothetical protein